MARITQIVTLLEQAIATAEFLVVDTESFPLVDLRVDWHDQPIAELRALWNRFAPEMGAFVLRALDPDDPRSGPSP